MPKVSITILRTVTITRDQSAVVELDVPQEILDEGDEELIDHVIQLTEGGDDNHLPPELRDQRKAIVEADWDTTSDEEDAEYAEAYQNI